MDFSHTHCWHCHPPRVPRKDLSGSLQLIMSQICFYCLTAQKDPTFLFKSVASSTVLCFAIFSYSPSKPWPDLLVPNHFLYPHHTSDGFGWWNKPALLITLCTTKLTGIKSTGNHGTSRHKQLKPCGSYMKMKKILQLFSSALLSPSLPQHFTELRPECLCSRVKLAQTDAIAGCPNQQFCDKYLLFKPWMKLEACWIAWG